MTFDDVVELAAVLFLCRAVAAMVIHRHMGRAMHRAMHQAHQAHQATVHLVTEAKSAKSLRILPICKLWMLGKCRKVKDLHFEEQL